jgi:hypothetical protein
VDTLETVRKEAFNKYDKAIKALTPYMKTHYQGKRIEIVQHIIPVSSLGSLNHITYLTLKDLLSHKPKKIINIWAKRLVVAAIKGSFRLWLKKCGYKDINLVKRADPNNLVKNSEEEPDGKRWLEERIQATQQCLTTDVELNEIEEKEDEIVTQEQLKNETPLLETFEEDLERSEEIKLRMNDITRKEELISYLNRTVDKWRKLWKINQDEREASQTIRFITQFFNRENVDTDAITRNVLTILWKKRLA